MRFRQCSGTGRRWKEEEEEEEEEEETHGVRFRQSQVQEHEMVRAGGSCVAVCNVV